MDLQATGANPGTEYLPVMGPPAPPYNEDRQVTLTGGPTQVYRTYNASFVSASQKWQVVDGTKSAYANVQSSDGSVHYYTLNTTTGLWEGSGNNTIYNSVDYGLAAGGSTSVNNAALNSLFTVLNNAPGPALHGGFVRIPQYNFPVVAVAYVSGSSPMGISVPDQVIIQGLGTGGQGLPGSNYHFTISDPSGATTASALFVAEGNHSIGGTEFRNLAFDWNSPAAYAGDTAVNVGFAATLVYRCTFTNCPTAVNFAGYSSGSTPDALGSVMRECQVKYLNGPNNATCVILAGQQTGIMGPSILLSAGAGGPTSCTGVAIGGGLTTNEHNVIDSVHFTAWATCVDYADMNGAIVNGNHSGCEYTTIANCEMDALGVGSTYPHAGACINLTTYADTNAIYGQKIVGNTLAISQNSTNSNPVVLIDTGALGPGGVGGPDTNVSSIDLIGNLIFSNIMSGGGNTGHAQPNTYGIQINAGDSIRVIGGKIGNMGTMAGNDGSANICISGNPTSVIIDSVDLRPTFVNAGGGSNGSAASQYALLISGTLNSGPVQVRNCDMSGFGGSPVGVTGSVSGLNPPGRGPLYITNCTGYNDQNTLINTLSNLALATAYAAYNQGGKHGTSYYGPSFVMFTASSSGGTFQINNGTAQTLLASQIVSVFLESPYDTIQFNSQLPSAFLWTGR